MRRLRKRWIAGLVVGLLVAPLARWGLVSRRVPQVSVRPTRVSSALQLGGTPVAIHAVPTGTISIKSCHQHACLPDRAPPMLRMLPIVFGTTFEAPMPIWSYVIEHPEGAIAVDTGELTRFLKDPNYGACDPGADWVFHEILAVDVREGEEQAQQLATLGLVPSRFLGVVITHQHPDHVGGVGAFQGVPIYMSRVDASLGGRAGQATCRNLEGANQRPHEDLMRAGFDVDADAAFGASYPLTRDRRVLVVPTPGHTPGSVSLLVKETRVTRSSSGTCPSVKKRSMAMTSQEFIFRCKMHGPPKRGYVPMWLGDRPSCCRHMTRPYPLGWHGSRLVVDAKIRFSDSSPCEKGDPIDRTCRAPWPQLQSPLALAAKVRALLRRAAQRSFPLAGNSAAPTPSKPWPRPTTRTPYPRHASYWRTTSRDGSRTRCCTDTHPHYCGASATCPLRT